MRVMPARRFAIGVLTNASGGTTLASTLIDGVVNDLFGIGLAKAPRENGSVASDPTRYEGTYEHVGRRFRIEAAGGRLRLVNESMWGMAKDDTVPLVPVSGTTFLGHFGNGESAKIGFVEPEADSRFRYAHVALRAFRRVE
jgi:hypothetical protein